MITRDHYGADLCGDELFIEDHGIMVPASSVRTAKRVGINKSREGFDAALRFFVKPADLELARAAARFPGRSV
jgi:3-methyladenine DNA glycosylase Mpg